ncbi:OLC1v1031850C1 [Oldenlandia corymbosa var. corymbosa]|uniref:OLC1v1031850C1 n=1 Tax=Oldenlandia corymbosa var. corymbosa TaxID=529605 RepID=A0AAV1CL86_OLDCO|nr:OLC1v1031850C1 [Oldenlandia corymbosa var. corymbosa]
MALRSAMGKSAATRSLLTRLINRSENHVPKAFSTASSTRSTLYSGSNDGVGVYAHAAGDGFRRCLDEFSLNHGSEDMNMDNPFQVTGPRGWYEVKNVDEGLYVRMEMPGIAKEDVKVWAEYGNLMVTGNGRKEWPLEAAGRKYSAHVEYPADFFREKDMKHELKNGVLRYMLTLKVDNLNEYFTHGQSDPKTKRQFIFVMIKQGSPQQGLKMENPLQSGGPKDLVAVDEVKDGLLVRILLPGVGEDGCKVWVENNTVFFSGKGDIECENEISGRSYGGSLEFDPKLNKVDEIKSEMKHGILRMIVPKAS